MNIPRGKGTMAESAVVAYLRDHGFPDAERRSLNGSLDRGDVTGTPGLCWEVKYANAGLRLSSWMTETDVERLNSGATYGILVIKPRLLGAKSTHRWYAAMRWWDHITLLERADEITRMGIRLPKEFSFTAGRLVTQLAAARPGRSEVLAPEQLVAVTAVPPGMKDDPERWIRVMHLDQMVTLVRRAGFGHRTS